MLIIGVHFQVYSVDQPFKVYHDGHTRHGFVQPMAIMTGIPFFLTHTRTVLGVINIAGDVTIQTIFHKH